MSKPKDPYPVTMADIERQTKEAHRDLRGHVAPRRNGKPILKKAKESDPYMIQHT